MKNYNLTVLVDVSKGEENAKECYSKIESIITDSKGKVFTKNFDGRIDLVSTFRKHKQAFMFKFQYASTPKTLEQLSNQFKINESIIRHMNVHLDKILEKEQISALTK